MRGSSNKKDKHVL